MDKLIEAGEDIPLSDSDIDSILDGQVRILSYSELKGYNSLHNALGPHQAMVLLYQFPGETVGHWVACWIHGGKVWHYDSYGLNPDAETRGETWYSGLLADSGLEVMTSRYKHQEFREHINTCGRHAALRLLFGAHTHDQYNEIVTSSCLSPDALATAMTLTHSLKHAGT